MTNALFCARCFILTKWGQVLILNIMPKLLRMGYAEILGEKCVGFEVRKGLASPGESTPRFLCIANFWVKSNEQFITSMADPGIKDMMEKISAFTDMNLFVNLMW